MKLDDGELIKENFCWWRMLSGRYLIEARGTGEGTANLVIFDRNKDLKGVFCKSVSLAFGAQLGPDTSDIDGWRHTCLDFIDNQYKP